MWQATHKDQWELTLPNGVRLVVRQVFGTAMWEVYSKTGGLRGRGSVSDARPDWALNKAMIEARAWADSYEWPRSR